MGEHSSYIEQHPIGNQIIAASVSAAMAGAGKNQPSAYSKILDISGHSSLPEVTLVRHHLKNKRSQGPATPRSITGA